jgi:zinc transporter ZupT
MATYIDVLLYSLIGGAISLVGGLVLIRNKRTAKQLALYGTPFAAGALLAAVFVDLLPEGVHYNANQVFIGCMFGFLGFFIFQRVIGSLHHHQTKTQRKTSQRFEIDADEILHSQKDAKHH